MNIQERQRDILFEACRKVATTPNCPKWIADFLRNEVMRAKQIKEEFPTLSDAQETYVPAQPLQVGDVVTINNNGVRCVARLLNEAIPVDGIRLFDVQVAENSKNHSVGQIFHNIPETMMTR